MSHPSRFTRLWGRMILIAGGTLVALLSVEAGLRIAGVAYLRQWDRDPDRGLVLVPNQEGWFCEEGCAFVRNNSAGFRDDERSVQKPPRTVRIALLGDSFVQAKHVAKDERFGETLERLLNDGGGIAGHRVEVLNFGVAGYGTAEALLTFRHVARTYSPDLVILAFFSGNDLINNVESLERKPNKAYMTLEGGVLELDTSFRQAPEYVMTWQRRLAYFAMDRSRLLQVAHRARGQYQGRTVHAERARIASSSDIEDVGINQLVFAESTIPEWKEAWSVTEAILVQMRREVEAAGARYFVVTLSMGPQVHPDPTSRERLQKRLGVPDLFYPDDRIRRVGEAHGFPVLNLARPFQAFAARHGTYLHGFPNTRLGTGHWNADGHRLAAQLIGESVRRLPILTRKAEVRRSP